MRAAELQQREAAALDAIVKRACAGDDAAFAEVYRHYRGRVFGLCRHILNSAEKAEDATSEVFLRARKAMSTYDSALPFHRWLLSIAGHYCIDLLRRQRIEKRLFDWAELEADLPPASGPSPLGEVLTTEQRDWVRQAIAALPEHYRLPLVLRYYSELSYDQIAAQLGLGRNNVATLIFRGKKELRRRLAPGGKERLQ